MRALVLTGTAIFVGFSALFTAPSSANAAQNFEELEERIQALETTIAALRIELSEVRQDASDSTSEVQAEYETLQESNQTALAESSEWQNAISTFHLAGYGDARYANSDDANGQFDQVTFNPIFHFMYRDKILWESELEFEITGDGETEVGLEYSAINWFLNDYVALVGGKFLSPLGQFRQNLHPAWINRLPSAPPGFGHDGAAPSADVGLQFRGGAPILSGSQITYSVFVANGPELDGDDDEVHGILTEGFTRDVDDPVFGGRVSILPIPRLELGVSGAIGKATVTVNDGEETTGDPARDYEAFGVDFVYQWQTLEARGEYIEQSVDDSPDSVATIGGTWASWYLQGAYRFWDSPWEAAIRYSDFSSPHPSQEQEQWALGANYLISPNAMIKLAYEFNRGLENSENDANRWLAQIAFGY